jgi:3-dehydroshikimate dehydratase
MMLKLAGFTDEISPDLDEQIAFCRETGITHLELRGVENRNVLDFDPPLRQKIKSRLSAAGLGVVCIGSPIGKVKISDPWEPHFQRFTIAVELAEFFAAPLIRVFSYYAPEGETGNVLPHRDEVLRRFREKLKYLQNRPLTLVHENEKHIYGAKTEQCVDLMRTIDSPQLRSAFDFANFIQEQVNPADAWPLLKPYTAHIHIKDARLADGQVVPAGQGDGHIPQILLDAYRSGYRGFLSLEPHLAAAKQFSGFSGPHLFKIAVDALKQLCVDNGIPLAAPR